MSEPTSAASVLEETASTDPADPTGQDTPDDAAGTPDTQAASGAPNPPAAAAEVSAPEAPVMQGPVPNIGRIVHYVLDHGAHAGECRPAIVVQMFDRSRPDPRLQLAVLIDGYNDGIADAAGIAIWRTSVPHSDDLEAGSWHWFGNQHAAAAKCEA